MALTNIELYEELKKSVTEEAARMIAEVVPNADDLATKSDIARLEGEFAAVRTDIARLGESLSDRMLRYFVPLWIAVYGSLATMVGLLVFLILGK
jgi:hypothetical protein